MILLFELIFITSILVLGYTIITQEGMALYSLRLWAEKKKDEGKKWIEPILLCHWCQPSIWSAFAFAFAFGIGLIEKFNWHLLFYYPLVVAGSSLLNGLIWGYHLKSNAQKEAYESEKECANIMIENSLEEYDEREYEERIYDHTNN